MPPARSSERNAPARSADTTTAAGKLLALLEAFGPEQPDFSLAELAVRAGLPKSTAHRILALLETWRGVERSAAGRYRLGIRFFELGGLVHDRLRLREVALPYMEDLLATTREMIHLAKLDGIDVLYIERLVSHRSVRSPSRVAGRVPATCTGVGKAILAFSPPEVVKTVIAGGLVAMTPYSITNPVVFLETLERIRRTGVSLDREEASIGLACVAAPIFGPNKAVVASMSVSGPVGRISFDSLIPAIRAATLAVSRHLGYHPGSAPSLPAPVGGREN
ncbi:MAG TPA: IclR family transcriptional regulator [Acidimicrobiia bacterium]